MSTASNSPRHSARHSARPASTGNWIVWTAATVLVLGLMVAGYVYSH